MTASDFDKPEFEVKIYFKALKKVVIKAEDRESAHKLAYNNFLDSSPNEIFSDSEVADFLLKLQSMDQKAQTCYMNDL